jgi:secondary thiamine-phosphate synthase enzyme
MIKEFRVTTNARTEFIDITQEIQKLVSESNVSSGVCSIHVPHTTAALTINENADPDVVKDMIKALNKIVPFDDHYAHGEGNSAAHIKSSMLGVSQAILVEDGQLVLGTWQGIYFCEFDGPRDRKVLVKVRKD